MRIMYTRAKLRFRLFSLVISALGQWLKLQTVENHKFLRSVEEGGSPGSWQDPNGPWVED